MLNYMFELGDIGNKHSIAVLGRLRQINTPMSVIRMTIAIFVRNMLSEMLAFSLRRQKTMIILDLMLALLSCYMAQYH
ncbi:hypothetical protein MHIR_DE00368 [Candidatus Doolittlea endobia]|uniref:Uncharacterized protein n=1 Tax=Candidatus Doolittlea endobia TaxID=1778262 RepID=A0A143WSY8_9ENTR|nr:hypothetical protein MHIR_DE00368 [Candidatus Doolittlea endobia]